MSSKRYWKISPGPYAKFWEEFREQGIIAIGPNRIRDLRKYDTDKEIINDLKNLFGERSTFYKQMFQFFHEIKENDFVIAYGSKKILGIGKVSSGYSFSEKYLKPKPPRFGNALLFLAKIFI